MDKLMQTNANENIIADLYLIMNEDHSQHIPKIEIAIKIFSSTMVTNWKLKRKKNEIKVQ